MWHPSWEPFWQAVDEVQLPLHFTLFRRPRRAPASDAPSGSSNSNAIPDYPCQKMLTLPEAWDQSSASAAPNSSSFMDTKSYRG
jgi:hypothetical protein